MKELVSLFLVSVLTFGIGVAQEIQVVSYNVESGGSDPNVVARRVAEIDGCDIWGLSEVQQTWPMIFEQAAEDGENADFRHVLGGSGGADRLLIIYDADKFELLEYFELDSINIGGAVRSPLVGRFKLKERSTEFMFMVNHLYRSNNTARHRQATMLNRWAATQEVPVIAVGDYNFDWSVTNGDQNHDLGYDNMTASDVFRWVRPATLVKTQASTTYNAVLDFVFASGEAKNWAAQSTILIKQGDFPDDGSTSDHRPVHALFNLASPVTASKQNLLDKIAALEGELMELKRLVEQMP